MIIIMTFWCNHWYVHWYNFLHIIFIPVTSETPSSFSYPLSDVLPAPVSQLSSSPVSVSLSVSPIASIISTSHSFQSPLQQFPFSFILPQTHAQSSMDTLFTLPPIAPHTFLADSTITSVRTSQFFLFSLHQHFHASPRFFFVLALFSFICQHLPLDSLLFLSPTIALHLLSLTAILILLGLWSDRLISSTVLILLTILCLSSFLTTNLSNSYHLPYILLNHVPLLLCLTKPFAYA